jgi:hypothetical protein
MESPAVAAWIAHLVFWGLLVYGRVSGALTATRIAVVIVLWIAAFVGFPFIAYAPARATSSSFVAVLDIALVLMIFKGDVRRT